MESLALLTSVAAVLVALFGTFVNLWLYRTQTDPEVIVFATGDEVEESLIWLVVQNIGKGLATDIRFRWRGARPSTAFGLTSQDAQPPNEFIGPLIKGIASLGPGSRRVFVWGQYGGIAAALREHGGTLQVECQYFGGRPHLRNIRRPHRREFVIDIGSFDETIARDSAERKISRSLERIEKKFDAVIRALQTRRK